ncbi:hypothetical protein [Microbacterium sp.]|uniref:hypothetical protein n=1 Tax=Microbacterium sp. TaxID=51671 RepID=UPI0037351CEA
MTGSSITEAEASKALFSSVHMHTVIAAIATIDGEEFSAPQIASLTGLAGSIVHGIVGRLQRAGVIERATHQGPDRTVLYRRRRTDVLDVLARPLD